MAVNKVVFGAVAIMDISDSTVTEDTLAKGVTAYDAKGEKITGNMEAIADPVLQSKTVTPSTSVQTVTADSGYDGLSSVKVNAMPTATQATPAITVSSSGLITAKATQSAGYVSAGTKSATKQLTTQAAQTITPGTTNKTIASGRYLTGVQTIKGDANLVPENIVSGKSIFGVVGTAETGGGGSGAIETITCTIRSGSPFGVSGEFHYVDGEGNYKTGTEAGTVLVMKNSLVLAVSGGDGFSVKGDATSVYEIDGDSITAFVTGDFTVMI